MSHSRDLRRTCVAVPTLMVLALSTTGCLGEKLLGRSRGVQTRLQREAIANGSKTIGCAPKETAIAEANLKFAEDALKIGEYYRGKEHVEKGESYTKLAIAKTDPVKCRDPNAVREAVIRVGDRDGDGYDDKVDGCPDHAEDFDSFKDDDGCPDPDNDEDKILDVNDKKDNRDCRNEPEDKDGFEDEDGCPDPDNDNDKILDAADRLGERDCRNDPEDYDQFEDEDGCPEPDNDNDKFLDPKDKCPNDPEDYDGDKDDDGCPNLLVDDQGDKIKTPTIYFKFNKWDIDPKSFPVLDDLATLLKQKPTIEVQIEGHTDSKGSDSYNKKLSQRRADSIRKYLEGKGIEPARMTSIGFGEEQPIDSNRSAEGRAANRRTEFKVTKR